MPQAAPAFFGLVTSSRIRPYRKRESAAIRTGSMLGGRPGLTRLGSFYELVDAVRTRHLKVAHFG